MRRAIEEFRACVEPRLAADVGAIGATRLRRLPAEVLEALRVVAGEARAIAAGSRRPSGSSAARRRRPTS